MRYKFFTFVSVLVFLITFLGCGGKKANKPIEVYGGMSIPGLGVSIEASYDPRLDNLAPGYKVLNVAMLNDSFRIIPLSPERDKWWIKTSKNEKKKYEVICDLRLYDSKAWHAIPANARKHIGYPLALPIGGRQVVDLFVKEDVPVEDFSEIIIYLSGLEATIKLLPRQ
ncbi:MAG: hypothetical protein ABH859_04410 [Pseudomonadota bacterium]